MVPLAVVVLDVLAHEDAEVPLAERDHATEALLLDRPDEPFGVRVEIGTLRRRSDGLGPATLQDLGNDTGVEGIAVVNQMAGRCSNGILWLDSPYRGRTVRSVR